MRSGSCLRMGAGGCVGRGMENGSRDSNTGGSDSDIWVDSVGMNDGVESVGDFEFVGRVTSQIGSCSVIAAIQVTLGSSFDGLYTPLLSSGRMWEYVNCRYDLPQCLPIVNL